MTQDLIQRLESATEPSRDLDLEILNAVSADVWYWLDRDSETITCDRYGPGAPGNPVCGLENYSGSIDDAMTLLGPPGYPLWTVTLRGRSHGQRGMTWTAEVTVPSSEFRGFSSAEPALALCAAALRARVGR